MTKVKEKRKNTRQFSATSYNCLRIALCFFCLVLQVGSGNATGLAMNMSLNISTTACNVVLGYKQPFDMISVHDANDAFKLIGVTHACTGWYFFIV